MNIRRGFFSRTLCLFMMSLLAFQTLHLTASRNRAQDTVTGAFEGNVSNSQTGAPIAGASVQFINQLTGVPIAKRSDSQGRFYQGLLPPGNYTIRVSAPGFQTRTVELRLVATRSNSVVPVPVTLDPELTATAQPTPTPTGTPDPTATPTTTTQTSAQSSAEDVGVIADMNMTDARRGGAFTEEEVSTLPLGGTTLVRSFDELALLLPGVAAPPQTIGNGTGPGVGAGVGTSGQFSVNGQRSRSNNFTVDGSDNNDEDIGVRRQGFFALIPQPIESIKEFQVISLLAPAQFGRNAGAQVNAISKSGGSSTHGTIYGFFNSSQLNARNVFDTVGGNTLSPLRANGVNVLDGAGNPIQVRLNNGDEDSFTLGQGGFVLGGPLEPSRGPNEGPRMFYFISAEGQLLNANKEVSFAVPTVAQRGFGGTGATGIQNNPFTGANIPGGEFPTALSGDAVFSFFPFPNNPTGVYGANTLTRVLPASAQGKVVSGKFDADFDAFERRHSFTARYNFTSDWRDIPAAGGGIFARLRPRVRTQNFSTFLNSELSGPNSTSPVFNQLRLSYGRTRLNFDEGRDPEVLPIETQGLEGEPFLLNRQLQINITRPGQPPRYASAAGLTTENGSFFIGPGVGTGPIGQLIIAGFSPVGVDVFTFPQRRVNNTYQVADTVTFRWGSHNFAVGADIRRTELNSALPRNSRPLLTFNGAPRIVPTAFDPQTGLPTNFNFATNVPGAQFPIVRPEDFAAAGAPSGFFQTLALTNSDISLRYYQLNFFAQDEWRLRRNLSLSLGLRYEYNTPPRELNERIENTFNSPLLSLVPGLRDFIDGRSQIYEADRNNFAPRVGIAWSPRLFGDRATVIRAGYGIFYDQIIGSVVSQSRNVFPNFLTLNFAGGCCDIRPSPFGVVSDFNVFNPITTTFGGVPIVTPGTLNTLNPNIQLPNFVNAINAAFGGIFGDSIFGATIPARQLETPFAHHYSVSFEQELNSRHVFSASYVGTQGRSLLRFTTPNLGQNQIVLPLVFTSTGGGPTISGFTAQPGTFTSGTLGRPNFNVGAINRFETNASSRYDALQLQLRGRFSRSYQYQVNYTFSNVEDDVSDVFDLAGAPALPQNSVTFAGERGPANFDARHRFSYNMMYELPSFRDRGSLMRFLFGGLEIASTGKFYTGQPFTVNSIFDVNLDGNLTDRLNNTNGLVETGDRSQPLRLTTANTFSLLAPFGQDGGIGRNTFRSGNILEVDLSFVKRFEITERQSLTFRMDIFNIIDRENYGIPVRFLEAPGFGRATDTVTPGRRIQFALKYSF